MKANLKPPNAKAQALLKKLQALAERGIDGEKISAQRKIARLQARFDFTAEIPDETPDLFLGSFKHASKARLIYSFRNDELEVANAVKWAIESETGIQCLYQGGDLLAEATVSTTNRLTDIAAHIFNSFRALLEKFCALDGVTVNDRSVFIRGLYDGMMNDVRTPGQRLPTRGGQKKMPKGKKRAVGHAAGLNIHPYAVAVSLGRQIRFSAPLDQIVAELQAVTETCLPQGTSVT